MRETRLAMDNAGKVFVLLAGMALGVAVGFLLPWLGGVAARFPIPFAGVIETLAGFDNPILVTTRPLIGAAVGAVGALVVLARSPQLTVTDEHIHIRVGDDSRRIPRAKVDGVYRSDGKLVIESAEGRRLFEDQVEGSPAEIRAAFVDHGYPWEND